MARHQIWPRSGRRLPRLHVWGSDTVSNNMSRLLWAVTQTGRELERQATSWTVKLRAVAKERQR